MDSPSMLARKSAGERVSLGGRRTS